MIENIHPNFEIDTEYFEIKTDEIFKNIINQLNSYEHILPYKNCSFDFDIIFCDDEKIQEINNEYRAKNCPTDVITFALFFDCEEKIVFENEINLGEIIISLDTAKKQAQEAKGSFEKEISTLIAHGILHLLGFDHTTEEDYEFVVKMQNSVVD